MKIMWKANIDPFGRRDLKEVSRQTQLPISIWSNWSKSVDRYHQTRSSVIHSAPRLGAGPSVN